jgi:hypothetical protein
MGLIHYPETSTTNYQPTLRNIVKQQIPEHKPNNNSHYLLLLKINFNKSCQMLILFFNPLAPEFSFKF